MITADIPNQDQPFEGQAAGLFARPWYRFFGILGRSKPLSYRPVASGFAVLVAGTVTVQSGFANSANVIQLTRNVTGGTVGHLSVGAIVAGTSFVINSTSATETSSIGWTIFQPIT